MEDAVLFDVICVALHGIRMSRFKLGDSVVVSGMGPVGLSAVQFLKAVKCYTDYIKKYRIFHFYIFRNRNDHGVCHIFDQQIFCVTAIRHSDTGSSRKSVDTDVCQN